MARKTRLVMSPPAPPARQANQPIEEHRHPGISTVLDAHLSDVLGGGVPGGAPGPPQPVTEKDLPPEVQAILGVVCHDGDCTRDQPVCPPDDRVTCQLIPADPAKTKWVRDWVKLPWRIKNAFKGDLILSPGGSSGIISSLLSQLDPPQHYTHMGIMTRDNVEVRHATASDDYLQDHPNGHIFLAGDQPSDGFEPDKVRFGWPGTITQSIDAAYNASLDDKYFGAAIKHADGKTYYIRALSFEPTRVNIETDDSKPPRWQRLQALVVQPCPALETDAVRQALWRIADAAMAIRGHYRFFAYTDATISEDPTFYGPPMYEAMMPDPKNPCGSEVKVERTIPVVCSTFIWAAVQRVNASGALPRIRLDCLPNPQRPDPGNAAPCASALERHPRFGLPLADPKLNGLYFYDEAQRINAGDKLYEYLHDKVRGKIAEKVPGIVQALGGGFISVGVLITAMPLPLRFLAILLGISLAEVQLLVDWLSDMPDDVANQILNAFASDWCETEAKDSDKWKKPGTGRSVSPDNILNCWSEPMSGLTDPREVLCGVYGYNAPVLLRPPQWQFRPLQAWAVSPGPATFAGQVLYKKQPINGARVTVCCRQTMTHRRESALVPGVEGMFEVTVPAGDYLAHAGYRDPVTGWFLEAEKEVSIPFPGGMQTIFELQDPPARNREIVVSGHMDIVSRVAFGHDWWGHPDFEAPHVRVGPYGKPNSPEADLGKHGHTSDSEALSAYGSVRLSVDVDWQPDFSVNVSWRASIFDGDDEEVFAEKKDVNLPADSSRAWIVDLKTGDAWPDRAHIQFSIDNNRQP
jgi:hypothetical protein